MHGSISKQNHFKVILFSTLCISLCSSLLAQEGAQNPSPLLKRMLNTPNKRITETDIPFNTDNHDPSNIILHKGKYYLRRTEHYGKTYNGFLHTRIEVSTSKDGINWTPRKVVLEPDPKRKWESGGVLTPYAVPNPQDGKFYLFYTAVGHDWGTVPVGPKRILYIDADGKNVRQLTHLGKISCPAAWSPDGKWISFRVTDNAFWRNKELMEKTYKEKRGDKRPVCVDIAVEGFDKLGNS